MKVLILAYDFPPLVSVGGLRPYFWFQQLKQYQIEPIVVTRQWRNFYKDGRDYVAASASEDEVVEKDECGVVVQSPYKPSISNKLFLRFGDSKFRFVRKILTGINELGQFYLPIGTKRGLYSSAKKYLSENHVDLIIATGEPFVMFHYANKLSKKFSIPWMADYRDPWSKNQEILNALPISRYFAFLERKVVKNSTHITTVSEFVKMGIKEVVGKNNIDVITNGYNPNAVINNKSIEQNSEFLNLAFVGSIYDWHPYVSFFLTLNEFAKNHRLSFRVNLYGINRQNEIQNLLKTRCEFLDSMVTIHPKMPNQDLMEELAKNNVLLLFNYYSYAGTKIYDYLASRRKILLCYTSDPDAMKLKKKHYTVDETFSDNKNVQKQILEYTNAGIAVRDKDHLEEVLLELYREHKEKGYVACDSRNIEEFSREVQVEKLAKIMKKVVSDHRNKNQA